MNFINKTILKAPYTLFLIGIGICTLSVYSCRGKKEQDAYREVFRYNQIGGLESLDPAFAKNLAIMWTVHLVYNTLVEVDSDMNIVPSLARRYEISEDGKTYTFTLRNDVFFHDNGVFPDGKGKRMTAADVVYSFNRLTDPNTASPGAWVFHDRVSTKDPFRVINDTTFQVRLQKPFGPFLEILSMPYCSIVPWEAVEKFGLDFRNHPCGTGPFQMVRWDEGNTLILSRNPHYWEKDEQGVQLPYLKAVQVSFNETRAMEFLLLKEGKLDFVNGIDGSMKDLILTKKGELKDEVKKDIQLTKRPYLNTEYIGILMDSALSQSSPLNIKKLRQAINLGIDRQKIVTYFRNGAAIPAYYGFTPSLIPGMQGRTAAFRYDPARAAALIGEVKRSLNGSIPEIRISTPESNADMCNFIAQELIDLGLKVRVQVLQPGLLRQMMSQGQVTFFKAQWIADYPDAETYLAFFYSPLPAPPNYTRFRDRHFDALYEAAIATGDVAERQKIYRKMDSLVNVNYPVVPLFYDVMLHFTSKDLSGFTANPMNIIDIKKVKKNKMDLL